MGYYVDLLCCFDRLVRMILRGFELLKGENDSFRDFV